MGGFQGQLEALKSHPGSNTDPKQNRVTPGPSLSEMHSAEGHGQDGVPTISSPLVSVPFWLVQS